MQYEQCWLKIVKHCIWFLVINVLQSVVAAIKPFQQITDLLSGEERVTCSAIKPMIQLIQETMVNHQDDDSALTCEIKDRINSDIIMLVQKSTRS